MDSIGQELRKEREKRNISLKEVADVTRISKRYLEALEEDRFDILPGGFFVKGIVRGYARAVGLDEALWIERLRRAGVTRDAEDPSRPAESPVPRFSRKTKLSFAGAAAVILAAATVGLYYLTRTPGNPQVPISRPVASPPLATELSSPPPAPVEKEAPAAVEEEKGLRLQITFIAETWIQVFSDGKPALDGLKLAGGRAEIRAESEILINLGNAGGLEYTLNGKPGRSLGKSGEVVKNIRITPENAASFMAAEGTR